MAGTALKITSASAEIATGTLEFAQAYNKTSRASTTQTVMSAYTAINQSYGLTTPLANPNCP